MSTLPIDGTISARPFDHTICATPGGSPESARSGTVRGGSSGTIGAPQRGTVDGEAGDSPENSAAAEVSGLISSLGSLSAQAQGLPLSPPTLPGLPQNQGYQPQATDYMQLSEDSN
jgi:hypothetical protein